MTEARLRDTPARERCAKGVPEDDRGFCGNQRRFSRLRTVFAENGGEMPGKFRGS